jgi:uncharacterized protein YbjT (DUF2867 family)
MAKTLVVGANGTVGSNLVQILAAKGETVLKATSKSAQKADEVHLNVATGAGRVAAFAGVARAYLLSPPGFTNQDQLMIPLIDAAKEAGVAKIVLMTAMGANADEASPMRKAELHLEKAGIAYNIVRPNWFMQNFNSYWIGSILAEGKIRLPVGTAKGSFIDARDIAAVVAELLLTNRFDNRDFDLTGGEALTHDEVASILARETGKQIVFEDITPEAMLPGLLGAGLPKAYAEFLLVILGYFKAGYSARIEGSVETITGKKPIAFAAYAKDYRAAWLVK